METTLPGAPPPSTYQLTQGISEIHSSVQESCKEISALAQLALAALHAPQEHHSPQGMAHALQSIRDHADLLASHVRAEARRLT